MITIFRRLREKLIASGSVTKYLLYAVGEILLVVVGILIALLVNNWNEERKEWAQEQQVISALHNEFNENHLDDKLINSLLLLNEYEKTVDIIEDLLIPTGF